MGKELLDIGGKNVQSPITVGGSPYNLRSSAAPKMISPKASMHSDRGYKDLVKKSSARLHSECSDDSGFYKVLRKKSVDSSKDARPSTPVNHEISSISDVTPSHPKIDQLKQQVQKIGILTSSERNASNLSTSGAEYEDSAQFTSGVESEYSAPSTPGAESEYSAPSTPGVESEDSAQFTSDVESEYSAPSTPRVKYEDSTRFSTPRQLIKPALGSYIQATPVSTKIQQIESEAVVQNMSPATIKALSSTSVVTYTAHHIDCSSYVQDAYAEMKALQSSDHENEENIFILKDAKSATAIVKIIRERNDKILLEMRGQSKKQIYHEYTIRDDITNIDTKISIRSFKTGGETLILKSLKAYPQIARQIQQIAAQHRDEEDPLCKVALAKAIRQLSRHEQPDDSILQNQQVKKLLSNVTCLLFIGEVCRNSSSTLTVHMLLDLIEKGDWEFSDLPTLFPMAMVGAVQSTRTLNKRLLNKIKKHSDYNASGPSCDDIRDNIVKTLLERDAYILHEWTKWKTGRVEKLDAPDAAELISKALEGWMGFSVKLPPMYPVSFSYPDLLRESTQRAPYDSDRILSNVRSIEFGDDRGREERTDELSLPYDIGPVDNVADHVEFAERVKALVRPPVCIRVKPLEMAFDDTRGIIPPLYESDESGAQDIRDGSDVCALSGDFPLDSE